LIVAARAIWNNSNFLEHLPRERPFTPSAPSALILFCMLVLYRHLWYPHWKSK
jgi:hypothetical protein